jgi:hypothetical protein
VRPIRGNVSDNIFLFGKNGEIEILGEFMDDLIAFFHSFVEKILYFPVPFGLVLKGKIFLHHFGTDVAPGDGKRISPEQMLLTVMHMVVILFSFTHPVEG